MERWKRWAEGVAGAWLAILGLLLTACLLPCRAEAADTAAYEQAQLDYLCGLASMASYDAELNLLVREKLGEMGWEVERFATGNAVADAKAYLVHRVLPETGEPVYILALTGTESVKDAEVDLRLRRVPFGGSTPAEFLQAAAGKADGSLPLVHQGFNDYTRTAFFTAALGEGDARTLGEAVRDALLAVPEAKVYITGHSLGGAAATLVAARLSDMGVPAEKLAVITFGAPAAGNEAFARRYESRMALRRITIKGDPVKAVLQSSALGYVQFGERVEWRQSPALQRFPHAMAVYLDEAIRHYYDAREALPEEERQPRFLRGGERLAAKVYVAPPQFSLDAHLAADEAYMRYAVADILRSRLSEPVFAPPGEASDLAALCRAARAAGCDYLLLDSFQGRRIQREAYNFRLTLEETIYDVQGNALGYQTTSATTREMTPIEGILYIHEAANGQRKKILQTAKF